MSFRTFFNFAYGFKEEKIVPLGTLQKIINHIAIVENTLGYEKEKTKTGYKEGENGPLEAWSWKSTVPKGGITDEVFCDIANHHNWYVGYLYEKFREWNESPPTGDTEIITPEQSYEFFYGLQTIRVPFERWTAEYYQKRMQVLYQAFKGQETEGVSFDAKPLTEKQAKSVLVIFQEYCGIDRFNLELDVPRGHDELCRGDELYWCEKCGESVHPDDIDDCRKRKCPLRTEYGEIEI